MYRYPGTCLPGYLDTLPIVPTLIKRMSISRHIPFTNLPRKCPRGNRLVKTLMQLLSLRVPSKSSAAAPSGYPKPTNHLKALVMTAFQWPGRQDRRWRNLDICLHSEQGRNLPIPLRSFPKALIRLLMKLHPCRISILSDTGTEEREIGRLSTNVRPSSLFTEQSVSRQLLKENHDLQV